MGPAPRNVATTGCGIRVTGLAWAGQPNRTRGEHDVARAGKRRSPGPPSPPIAAGEAAGKDRAARPLAGDTAGSRRQTGHGHQGRNQWSRSNRSGDANATGILSLWHGLARKAHKRMSGHLRKPPTSTAWLASSSAVTGSEAGAEWRTESPVLFPVHPRAGGEHTLSATRTVAETGSSPRGRRTRRRLVTQIARQRFIPARAGNTRRP